MQRTTLGSAGWAFSRGQVFCRARFGNVDTQTLVQISPQGGVISVECTKNMDIGAIAMAGKDRLMVSAKQDGQASLIFIELPTLKISQANKISDGRHYGRYPLFSGDGRYFYVNMPGGIQGFNLQSGEMFGNLWNTYDKKRTLFDMVPLADGKTCVISRDLVILGHASVIELNLGSDIQLGNGFEIVPDGIIGRRFSKVPGGGFVLPVKKQDSSKFDHRVIGVVGKKETGEEPLKGAVKTPAKKR